MHMLSPADKDFFERRFRVFFERLEDIATRLSRIERSMISSQQIRELMQEEQDMHDSVRQVVDGIAQQKGVIASVVKGFQDLLATQVALQAKLDSAIDAEDETAIAQASKDLKANNDAFVAAIPQMANAVAQNTGTTPQAAGPAATDATATVDNSTATPVTADGSSPAASR